MNSRGVMSPQAVRQHSSSSCRDFGTVTCAALPRVLGGPSFTFNYRFIYSQQIALPVIPAKGKTTLLCGEHIV